MGWVGGFMKWAGRGLSATGGAANIAGGAGVLYGAVKNAVPRLEDEVTVEVMGQPGAVKKQLYYLALAAGFGLIKRFDLGVGGYFLAPPPGFLMVEYDAADNWVRATIRFNTGLAAAAATQNAGGIIGEISGGIIGGVLGGIIGGPVGAIIGSIGGGLIGNLIGQQIEEYITNTGNNPNGFYAQAIVYSGPRDDVIGGKFGFTGVTTPLIPSTARSPGAPQLPFEGQVILTTSPLLNVNGRTINTPNPRPPGDNRSRGMVASPISQNEPGIDGAVGSGIVRYLIPLVFAALSDPGSNALEIFPPPIQGPGGF